VRVAAAGLILLALASCGPRHGDPLGPDWLPEAPRPTWGRTWRASPPGPVAERTIDHIADGIVGVERFRACLRPSRSQGLVLTVRFSIRRDGSVQNPTLAGTTEREPALERCLLAALARTRFVAAGSESIAEWTFVHRVKKGVLGIPAVEGSPAPTSRAPAPSPLADTWLRACYGAGRAVDPELNGHIAFRYLIDPSGRVNAVRDEGSRLSDHDVLDCVAELLYAQRLAPHSGYRIAVRTVQLRSTSPFVITD